MVHEVRCLHKIDFHYKQVKVSSSAAYWRYTFATQFWYWLDTIVDVLLSQQMCSYCLKADAFGCDCDSV